MKILIVSSYPLVDTVPYKGHVLEGLVERGVETRVVYAGTSLVDYFREARRRNVRETLIARLRDRAASTSRQGDGRSLRKAARDLGIPTTHVRGLAERSSLELLYSFAPDIVLNLSALYVPPAFLAAANHRVVGAHYGDLPRLRGLDTIRWSILVDHPLVVCHMLLGAELDMGDVVLRGNVPVRYGDDICALRRRCQDAAARGHLEAVDLASRAALRPTPQRRADGSTFYRMGRFLRGRVDDLLRGQRYSHYVDGSGA